MLKEHFIEITILSPLVALRFRSILDGFLRWWWQLTTELNIMPEGRGEKVRRHMKQ